MATSLTIAALACLLLALASASTEIPGPPPHTLGQLGAALKRLGYPGVHAHFEQKYGHYHPHSQPRREACPIACDILSYTFQQVDDRGSAGYGVDTQYWSLQQNNTKPRCYFYPDSAQEVAGAVLISQFTNCPFAAKSGGHACFSGASNIQNGVTIDLQKLNQIDVSEDQTTTSIGPGNHWIDVYSSLSPQNLSVIGGRVSAIGVGGLTLGGGVSFFSGRHGWACDNVRNYELVLANGQILDVNYTSYPDLYYALRGGGNNFGIVTRFDVVTFEQGLMWGGMVVYAITANASIFEAFEHFAHNAPSDPDAALICSFAYAEGQYFASNALDYAKPIANPPIFHNFTNIPGNFSDTLRITTLPNITNEFEAVNPAGLRETYTTATFKVSAALQGQILDIFVQQVEAITDVPSILPALVMQPITHDEIRYFKKNGGNALGLSDTKGPLLLVNLAVMWQGAEYDARVFNATNNVISQSIAVAAKMGLDNPYIYQNYASRGQDVFGGYGQASKDRLIQTSKKYDPYQVFQRLQPGYFKLSD